MWFLEELSGLVRGTRVFCKRPRQAGWQASGWRAGFSAEQVLSQIFLKQWLLVHHSSYVVEWLVPPDWWSYVPLMCDFLADGDPTPAYIRPPSPVPSFHTSHTLLWRPQGSRTSPPPDYEPGVLPLHYTSGKVYENEWLFGGLEGGADAATEAQSDWPCGGLTCMTTCKGSWTEVLLPCCHETKHMVWSSGSWLLVVLARLLSARYSSLEQRCSAPTSLGAEHTQLSMTWLYDITIITRYIKLALII